MGKYISTTAIYTDTLSRVTSSIVPTATLTEYIADAEGIVDSYIAKQYDIADIASIYPIPRILSKATKDMTLCLLFSDAYTKDNQNNSDWVQNRCDRAYQMLTDIANDKIKLVSSNTAINSNINISMKSSMSGKNLIFNIDDEYDWKEPQTLLDDISDKREIND